MTGTSPKDHPFQSRVVVAVGYHNVDGEFGAVAQVVLASVVEGAFPVRNVELGL
jgi:hypothetical protein